MLTNVVWLIKIENIEFEAVFFKGRGGQHQALIAANLWPVCGDGWKKTSAAVFLLCFSSKKKKSGVLGQGNGRSGGEPPYCIFTLDCILTLLRHIIAVCFISHSRSAAARKQWGELARLPILYLRAQKHSESSPNLKRSKVGAAVAASFRGTTLFFPPPLRPFKAAAATATIIR